MGPPAYIFFFKTVFVIQHPLRFHMNFKMDYSIHTKNVIWILIGIALNLNLCMHAKSLQLCLTLQPHGQQPTMFLCPRDSLGKNTGVGCHFFLQSMKVKSESEVAQSCPTLRDPMDCSLPGSSVHGVPSPSPTTTLRDVHFLISMCYPKMFRDVLKSRDILTSYSSFI